MQYLAMHGNAGGAGWRAGIGGHAVGCVVTVAVRTAIEGGLRMPRQWALELAAEPARPIAWRFDVLHAIACSVFERPGDAHDAADKAFTIRAYRRTVVLSWLDDRNPPTVRPQEPLMVGDEKIAVAGVRETVWKYAEFETGPMTAELGFKVSTPALFRHHGRNYPLPDPYITFASLARRYRAYRPEVDLDDDLIKDLGRAAMITSHRIRTERFPWHGRTDSGFVGTFAFRLGSEASTRARAAFGTLGAFAGIAGLGRGTTHGLGATTVTGQPHGGGPHGPARPHGRVRGG